MSKVKVINVSTPVEERRFDDSDRLDKERQIVVRGTGTVTIKTSSDGITYTAGEVLPNKMYRVNFGRLLVELECTGDSTVEVGG